MTGVAIAASALAGALLGWLGVLPPALVARLDQLAEVFLAVVLLGVGVEIGRGGEALRALRRLGARVVLIPLLVAAGSIAAGLAAAPFLGLARGEAAAVAAGFGWYSLSAVLLTRLGGPELGALAFLANIGREFAAILLIPLVARWLGPAAAIAPGGATAMDVTLPVITRAAGRAAGLAAFTSGLVLSLLVPLAVALALRL